MSCDLLLIVNILEKCRFVVDGLIISGVLLYCDMLVVISDSGVLL